MSPDPKIHIEHSHNRYFQHKSSEKKNTSKTKKSERTAGQQSDVYGCLITADEVRPAQRYKRHAEDCFILNVTRSAVNEGKKLIHTRKMMKVNTLKLTRCVGLDEI